MRKSKPLLVASAGAATIVLGCKPKAPVPDRIGPPPTRPVATQEALRIGPPWTPATPLPTPVEATPAPTPTPIRIGPAPRKLGTLELSAEKPVRIWIGGKLVGVTPLKIQLPPGAHTIRVERDSLFIRELKVQVREGETTSKTIALPEREKPVKTPIRIGVYRPE